MMAKQLNIKRFFKTPGQAIPTDENNNHASEIHVQEDELDVAPENGENEKAESGPPGAKKKKRSFNTEWYSKFPWLKTTEDDGMLCDFCVRATASNPFTTEGGCKNWQNSTLTRHQQSRDHIDSVQKLELRANMAKSYKITESRNTALQSDKVENYIKQMRLVYVMAKNDIASRNFEDLMHVQVLNGITCDYYKKPEILSEFEQCFENVIEKNLIVRINESPYLGIMLDETCDISVEKKLAIYIRFIENGKATVAFLGNRHITDCKASGIEEALVEFLVSKGICTENLEKVFGLGTDGAAVMTGRLNGLGAKLKRRNAELVQVHCVAHRLNLAVSQAGKHNEYCQAYHSKIHSLYDYYTNSQPRYDRLRELQVLLHGKAQQVTEPTSVRWLSVEACVKKVFTSYDAIVMSLEGEKDPKAIGLFHFIANTLFLLVTALLIDVLTVIGILSLTFQKDSVDLSQIRHCLVSTTSTLEAMKNGSDQVDVVLQALGNVPPAGVKNSYNGVDIIDNNQLRQRFSNLRESYLNTLMEYLGDRFPENDIDLLECFDKVLNPMRYPNSAAEIQQYGQDQLETLCEHYNAIDRNRAHAAFLVFKHLTKSYKGVLSFPQYCSKLITELDDQYPDFATLARLALIIPVSSAPCERGFSVQNALKTKVRNRLNPERLNRLMFIKLVGPDVDQFDFPVAARMFENMKPRMNWYFGPLSREETNEMFENVQTNGVFLVRDSQSIKGDFVLCVREDSKISHYIVNRIQQGNQVMFRIGDHQFPDIPALLNFYKTHYLDTTALTYPAPREKVIAKYDFPGKDPEDLPFKKGEILEILTKDEEKWWMARNKEGQTGQIPVPYVTKYDGRDGEISRTSSVPHTPEVPPQQDHQMQPKIFIPDNLPARAVVIMPRIPSVFDKSQLRLKQPKIFIPDNLPARAVVVMPRIPSAYQRETQLTLKEGEIINVLKINANGQWEGETEQGQKGLFPFTHVKFLEENL